MSCCTFWISGWWEECCCKHDFNYYKSGLSRKESDIRLRECVISKSKYKLFGLVIAYCMYAGVRIGGHWRYERKQSKGIKSG